MPREKSVSKGSEKPVASEESSEKRVSDTNGSSSEGIKINVTQLQNKRMTDLAKMAKELGIEYISSKKKLILFLRFLK